MSDVSYRRFRNALAILRAIDRHEMEAAGVRLSGDEWRMCGDDPCRFFLTIGGRAERLFGLIEARQPAALRERVSERESV